MTNIKKQIKISKFDALKIADKTNKKGKGVKG